MASFIDTRFPTIYSAKAEGGDMFTTNIITLENGSEQRISVLSQPKASWVFNEVLALKNKHEKLSYELIKEIHMVARGRFYCFRYRDFYENTATEEEGILGNGYGNSKPTHQLIKKYEVSNKFFNKDITLPVVETVKIFVDDVELPKAKFSVNPLNGKVTLSPLKKFSVYSTTNSAYTTQINFLASANHTFQVGEKVYINNTNTASNLYRKVFTVLETTPTSITIDGVTTSSFGSSSFIEKHYNETNKLSASFEFDYLVRFDNDDLPLSFDGGAVRLNGLKLVEVKDKITEEL